jgi:type IV pilus assembly protein PilX
MKTDNIHCKFSKIDFKHRRIRTHAINSVGFSSSAFAYRQLGTTTQKGATLFTALIFMIMLTILGVNVAQHSVLEERMSGNTRSRDLAFQSAEGALKQVEKNLAVGENLRQYYIGFIPTNTDGTVQPTEPGIRNINVCLPNSAEYWNETGAPDCTVTGTTQSFSWSAGAVNSTARTPLGDLNQVYSQPMYVVERYPNAVDGTEKYRVTARAVGGDSNTVVILQTIISYK